MRGPSFADPEANAVAKPLAKLSSEFPGIGASAAPPNGSATALPANVCAIINGNAKSGPLRSPPLATFS